MDEAREVEVKLRIADPGAARETLRRLGAQLARERHFEDNLLFDDAQGSLLARGTVLRLRRTPQGGVLTYKGPRGVQDGVKSREERETAVDGPDAVGAILQNLGYRPIFRYQKYRETWTYRGQEIEVDETPIGVFLEIEGDADGIHAVAAELGYGRDDYVTESYVGLFLAGGGKGDMVFPA
jgi:adenylate cyclase class 2